MSQISHTQEIFSFHCFELPIHKLPFYLFFYLKKKKVKGLIHSETLMPMQLGASLFSFKRYHLTYVSVVAFWKSEDDLDQFLVSSQNDLIGNGWHVRLKMYRRWGKIRELSSATLYPRDSNNDTTTVAITLARLKISQLFRFTKWGKPVEKQVRDHSGKVFAFAAFRPFGNFLTFSIWNSENEMIQMVHGQDPKVDGFEHREAMAERNRKDFHTEFTTLRFEILKEVGMRKGPGRV